MLGLEFGGDVRRRRADAEGGEQALQDPGGAGDGNPARFRFEPTPEGEALSLGAYLDDEALAKVIQTYDEGAAGDAMGGKSNDTSAVCRHTNSRGVVPEGSARGLGRGGGAGAADVAHEHRAAESVEHGQGRGSDGFVGRGSPALTGRSAIPLAPSRRPGPGTAPRQRGPTRSTPRSTLAS